MKCHHLVQNRLRRHEKVNSETMNSSINDAESVNDVNSAKVAATKAAELGEF